MNCKQPITNDLIARRALLLITFGLVVQTQSGCQIFQRFRQTKTPVPVVLETSAPLEQLIAAVQQQTDRVSQLKSEVRVSSPGMPGLRGDLQIERPNRIRLQAGVMGISELGFDLGSNDDGFWIWKKAATPGDPATLYYSSHDGYQQSVLLEELQLQPLWLIDALGLIQFHPEDRHTGPFSRGDGRVEIRTYSNSPARPAIRLAVIDPRRAIVNQQSFYDREGHRLAYLNSIEHQYYPEHEVSLPQRIEINLDGTNGQSTKLTVDAERYVINSLFGDPKILWTMPNPPDVRKVNLSGSMPTTNHPVEESAPVSRESRAPDFRHY